jgi:hypothetical protein
MTILAVVTAALLLNAGTAAAAGDRDNQGDHRGGDHSGRGAFTFAVIGDIPYGDQQIATFPARIDQLDADPQVQLVAHLGDIKSGSSVCSDEYFAMIKTQFDRFKDPLVYTPGDNEWTDCHRPNNGGYNPLERLTTIRQVFFADPGTTLGRPMPVTADTVQGFPENVRFDRAGVAFAAVHIVGSNNSLAPWTGNTTATPEQTAEVLGRTADDIGLIRDTFRTATAEGDRAVVLFTQADMFDATVSNPQYADYYAFQPIVQTLAAEAARFRGPVYLINGDSHVYRQDQPLAAGSPWLTFYGIGQATTNLTRYTVEGSTNVDEWLKVTVNPRGTDVLTFTRVPYTT